MSERQPTRFDNPYKPNSPEWQLMELAISQERQGISFAVDADRSAEKSRTAFGRAEEFRAAALKLVDGA